MHRMKLRKMRPQFLDNLPGAVRRRIIHNRDVKARIQPENRANQRLDVFAFVVGRNDHHRKWHVFSSLALRNVSAIPLLGGGRGGFPASSRQQPTPAPPKRGIRGHSIARGRKAITLLQLIGGHVNIVAEQAGMRLRKGGAGML